MYFNTAWWRNLVQVFETSLLIKTISLQGHFYLLFCSRSCCQCSYSKRNQKIAARLKACKCNRSAIPKTLSKFLRFCDSYWCLNEYNAKWLQVPRQNSSDEENDSACISSTPDDSSSDDNDVVSDLSCSDTLPTLNEKNVIRLEFKK